VHARRRSLEALGVLGRGDRVAAVPAERPTILRELVPWGLPSVALLLDGACQLAETWFHFQTPL
jgi:hypothetical protein